MKTNCVPFCRLGLAHSLVAVSLLTAACFAPAQQWATYQGDIRHSGFSPIEVGTAAISQAWQVQLQTTTQLTQVAADGSGMAFASGTQLYNNNGTLTMFGLNAATGAPVWSASYENYNSLTPPAVYNGSVYFQTIDGDENGFINCYSGSGEFTWRQPFYTQWGNFLAPTIDAGALFMVGGEYGGMYAFQAADGTSHWFCNELEQYDQWTPSLDTVDAYAYTGFNEFGTMQAGLYAVNRETGQLDFQIYDANYVWNGYSMGEAPALSGSMAYCTNGNRLVAFDLAAHNIAWQISRDITGQADVAGNVVYVNDAGTLSAFNASTGAFMWAWLPPSGTMTKTFVVTNNLAFVSTDTTTYATDLTTHAQVWSTANPGNLSIANGFLYIAGPTGMLTAVNLSSLNLQYPTNYQIIHGLPGSGTLNSLLYNDSQFLNIGLGLTAAPSQAPVQIILTGTSPSRTPNQLKFHLQAEASESGLTETVEAWNYSTAQWTLVSSGPARTTDTAVEASITNPVQYVNPSTGQMQARISWIQNGPISAYPWDVSIDQAVWLEG